METNHQQRQLLAELEEARRRASYWKQRAKSAEGHLYASDARAAALELHRFTSHKSIPWNDLAEADRSRIEIAAFSIVAAIRARIDTRRPRWPEFIAIPVEYQCACGDAYPGDSFGAGFMAANNGVCENCDAAASVTRGESA